MPSGTKKEKKMAANSPSPSIVQALAGSTSQSQAATPGSSRSQERKTQNSQKNPDRIG